MAEAIHSTPSASPSQQRFLRLLWAEVFLFHRSSLRPHVLEVRLISL